MIIVDFKTDPLENKIIESVNAGAQHLFFQSPKGQKPAIMPWNETLVKIEEGKFVRAESASDNLAIPASDSGEKANAIAGYPPDVIRTSRYDKWIYSGSSTEITQRDSREFVSMPKGPGYLRCVDQQGREIIFNKILMTAEELSKNDKTSVFRAFGHDIINSYGKDLDVINVSFVLYNNPNVDWANQFDYLFDNFIRSSKSIEKKYKVSLISEEAIFEIICVSYRKSSRAVDKTFVTGTMSCYVVKKIPRPLNDGPIDFSNPIS